MLNLDIFHCTVTDRKVIYDKTVDKTSSNSHVN